MFVFLVSILFNKYEQFNTIGGIDFFNHFQQMKVFENLFVINKL